MTNHNLMTRLAVLRRRRGLTMLEVAHRMGLSSTSRYQIYRIEHGLVDPRLRTVLHYAGAVGARLTIHCQPTCPATPRELMIQLSAVRVQRRLTQRDVATALGGGMSNRYVSRIETGVRCPRLSILARYADAVGARIAIQVDPPTRGGAR